MSPTQRDLPENTQHSQETELHARMRDLNPQSQQARGCRPTPWIALPLGSAYCELRYYMNLVAA